MIRMIEPKDEFACWWWYNWYISHSTSTFETEPLQQKEFSDRIHQIRERFPWIVLQEEDVIVGYAYLSSFNTRAAYNWTCDLAIYLAPDKLGMGYGTQLMKAIIDLAEKDGYKKMISIVTEGNQASERLHEKFGFEKKGFFEKVGYKAGEWLGVTYYMKDLNPTEIGQTPAQPRNLDPYRQQKPHRVPIVEES